jgi:acetolactate synthase I/II/III large subunit
MKGHPMTKNRILSYQLTDYLEKIGVEVIFGLCGHTNIAFLDALGKSNIRFITTRHEQLAGHMADGYARATGRPGVVLTHLGPGLTNAATGVANAALDGVPLVVIAGDVPTYYFGRHPHQEMNLYHDASQHEIYRPFAKRIWQVERPSEFPRIIERAFYTATTGKPGAVLVDVPMDVFSAELPDGSFDRFLPSAIKRPTLDDETAAEIAHALIEAQHPVIHVGGGVIRDKATPELIELVEHLDIPVTHTLMGKGAIPDRHPLRAGMTGFWGTPLVHDLTLNADLVLAIGTRLAEADSSSWDQKSTFKIGPTRLIHIEIDGAELGRNYCPEIAAVSDSKLALRKIVAAAKVERPKGISRNGLRERIRNGIEQFMNQFEKFRTSDQFPLRPERILNDVRAVVPEDGYIVTDVGWNKNGVGQQFDINNPGTFITPGALATMGFGPAAALGVKIGRPDKPVLALIGDGAFSSNMSVVATAVEAGIPVVWLVMDNLAFGTIALLEKNHYGWSYGCLFEDSEGNPYSIDYAMVARACGAEGITIDKAQELRPALEKAFTSGKPTLIHCRMENIPTPTPGYWNINDIYRSGD